MSPIPTSRRISPALGLLTAALGLALGSAHAETAKPATDEADPTQQLQLASRQYAELQQMLSLDKRCHWLEPAARTALDATAQERLAWFNAHGGQAGHPEAAARQAVAAEASLDCTSEKAKGLSKAIQYASWQMRVTWALRGEALLDGTGRPAWYKGKSGIAAAHRAALEEAAKGLEAKHGVSIQRIRPGIRQEAESLLAVRCTAADRECPKADSPALRAYAEEWLKQAERYAAVLSKTKDKVGAPPQAP
ncbi:hypothetical protein B1992_06820 [Pseudoxanthomonas broegbernensis]|uniref:Lysozyme inhibitor LprI N-terminal domain-containing protein n=1 Tax=Pseudoxanthomonas broegbernensis TaxID=83619 RepID=A0A7V8GMQ1_9GAMM|nr:hypothetical protein [Pseudoxanthomonas broegbernensis]KAF1686617.1 hypothetical protein B1992_06820 [Pseudoxanthomonas broegbernensis]MBB6063630.1 hypothetical protein [Pseudoxanthomonas broegbernensis]